MDDTIRFVKEKEKALAASRKVREELGRYGLLVLEDKSAWRAGQTLVWTPSIYLNLSLFFISPISSSPLSISKFSKFPSHLLDVL